MSLAAIVALAAWGWVGTVARRDLADAAALLESDLRLAQQEAVANAGTGPRAELCLRPDGYDVYTTAYAGDPLNAQPSESAAAPGRLVKSVRVGRELAAGIAIAPPGGGGTVGCVSEPGLPAVAFAADGEPLFSDGAAHAVTLTLRGQSVSVTIQPLTGAVQGSP